jgi:alpha 1,6-mannosyltransferase
MLNPRRAFIAAAFLLTVFFLISRSHTSESSASSSSESQDAAQAEMLAAAEAAASSQQRAVPPPPPQKPMIDMSGMSTYEKLDYAYTYDIESKFPAYIWQTWKYTPGEGDFEFREQEASWSIEHPGFIHEVITDAVAETLLQLLYASIPEILETYHALPMPVLKADFFRYLILYARGGIYSDIDTYAIKSAIEWIPPQIPKETVGLVIGIEADPDRLDWADWYSRRIQFCQWTIQAKPGHPVLRDIISRITNSTLTLKKAGKLSGFKGNNVVDFTGPAIWTDVIMDYFNDERFFDMEHSKGKIDYRNFTGMETSKRVGDVVVLPITSFSPGVGQMGAKDYDDPMAFVKHDFEGKSSNEEDSNNLKQHDVN